MKKSKKNSLAAAGMILVLLLAGVIFFFTYYQVDEVQVMGSSHYSEKQIKKMVLRGPLASNSVLAPLLYTKQNTKDVPFTMITGMVLPADVFSNVPTDIN